MSSLKQVLQQLPEPTKEIGNMLIEFYDTMKALEKDAERGGKQATKIVMTISDFETFHKQFSIGFANFIETNEQYLHYWKSKYTTEQLFKIYIEQL
jgi:hypothetical protein